MLLDCFFQHTVLQAGHTQLRGETGHEHLQSTVSDLVNLPTAFGKLVLSFMHTHSFGFEEASLGLSPQELN